MLNSRQASLRPENDWEAADLDVLRAYYVALTRLRSVNYVSPETERTAAADWSPSVHEHLRPSNVFVSRRSPAEQQRTPDEKRYKELTQKYYDETITKEEQLELVKIQGALDEADAKDPEVVRLNKGVNEGYDKLHSALRQINRILDEVLAK
jgi:hypothetical protein